jgi:O-antigen/teichoic acid export membrane protein
MGQRRVPPSPLGIMTATIGTRLAELVRSDFLRQIGATLGTRAGLIAASLFTSVLVARSLGPDGRGIVAVAGAFTAIGVQLGNLGLHASNTWAVSRRPSLLPALTANAVYVSVIVGTLEVAIVLLIGSMNGDLIPVKGPLLAVALLGIPVGLAYLLLQNLLLGLQRIRDYNLVELGVRLLSILATAVLIVTGLASPLAFLIAGTLLLVLSNVVLLGRLRQIAAVPIKPSLGIIAEYGRFGLKAYSTALASFLVLRFDLLLVERIRGVGAAGYYSIAVAMCDLVYMLPVIVGTLLFPRLSRMESPLDQVGYARDVALRVAAAMVVAACAAGILAQPVIEVLYGEAFVPAIPAFLWLLPGIVALSVHTIIMNYCASVGLPPVVLLAPVVGLLINLALNLALLPTMGIVGASIASTVAYVCMLAVSATYFIGRLRAIAPDRL